MANCTNCGNQIPDGMKFCPTCGTKVQASEVPNTDMNVSAPAPQPAYTVSEPVYTAPAAETANQGTQAPKAAGSIGNKFAGILSSKLLIPIVAALAVVIVLVICVSTGVFAGPRTKILKALERTFKPEGLLGELNAADFTSDGDFSADFNMTIEQLDGDSFSKSKRPSVGMGLSGDMNKGEYGFNINFKYDDAEISGTVFVDRSSIVVSVPDILDKTIVYDFTSDVDGFLGDAAPEEYFEFLNSVLQFVTSKDLADSSMKFGEDVKKIIKDNFEKWDIETVSKEKNLTVDGEKRSCKGYRIKLDQDNLLDLVDDFKEVYKEYMDTFDELQDIIDTYNEELRYELGGSKIYFDTDDIDEVFDELEEEIDDMEEEFEITFYLYKSMVAGIIVEWDDGDCGIELDIKGGDRPLQNFEVIVTDGGHEESLKKTGKLKDSGKEVNRIEVDGESIEWTYTKKDGSFEFSLEDDFVLKGSVKKSGSEVNLTISELSVEDDITLSGALVISDKAKIDKPKAKGEFKLNSAEEDDFEDLTEEVQENIMELIESFGDLF